MKKILLTSVFLFSFVAVFAQHEGIIYKNYEPDSCFTFQSSLDTIWLDINQDGQNDIVFTAASQSGVGLIVCIRTTADWQWSWTYINPFSPLNDSTLINDDNLRWNRVEGALLMYPDFTRFAFRTMVDEKWYYGWGNFFLDLNQSRETICASGTAFCTIPNYPLRWGQTSLSADVNESNGNKLATILPNPTNGVFNVTGENLKRIEIYDVLGQKVLSLNVDDDCTNIDLGPHPAGVYLINVTDQKGKTCAAKLVKQ